MLMPARPQGLPARLDRSEAHDLGVEGGDARRHDPGERGYRPGRWARVSLMTMTAAAPSLRGQLLPAVISPSGRKAGFSSARLLDRGARRGAVVGAAPRCRRRGQAGLISRSKKPFSCEATRPLLDRAANRSMSLTADPLQLPDVLGRLPHGDVDVGQPGRRCPRLRTAERPGRAALLGFPETRRCACRACRRPPRSRTCSPLPPRPPRRRRPHRP